MAGAASYGETGFGWVWLCMAGFVSAGKSRMVGYGPVGLGQFRLGKAGKVVQGSVCLVALRCG